MSVELTIERLVLRGIDETGAAAIGDALRAELERLLTEEGIPPSLRESRAVEYLDAGRVELEPGAGPGAIGARIARRLYTGWQR